MSGWWVAAFAVQWVLVVVLCVVVVALARQVGVLHLRLGPLGALEVDDEGPVLGEPTQSVTASGLDGHPTVLGGPGPGRLVVFVSPTCPLCEQVLPSVAAAASLSGLVAQVVSDPSAEQAWGVPGVPFVVILNEAGVVRAKGTVNNLEQLEGLVDTASRRAAERFLGVPAG